MDDLTLPLVLCAGLVGLLAGFAVGRWGWGRGRPPAPPPPPWPARDRRANGESDPEYVTVILRACRLPERWERDAAGRWVSSVRGTRDELESLVALIKARVVQNVEAHRRLALGAERVRRYLETRGPLS